MTTIAFPHATRSSIFPLVKDGLLLCLLSLTLSFSMFAAAAGNTIVIGQVVDLSSQNGAIGRDYVAGIKTYFDSINSNGGINGKHIQFIVRDDQGQADLAAKSATELLEHEKADFLIGGVGDDVTQAILSAPAFKHSGQSLYAPLTAAVRGDDGHVVFWRPSYQQELQYIFSYFAKLGIKDVGVALQDTAANQTIYNNLLTELSKQGLRLTGTARLAANGDLIPGEVARLSRSKPGFVLTIGDTITTGLFLKEFRKSDPQTFVAGTSLINLSTLRELAGPSAVRWTVFSQVVPNPNSGASPIQSEHMNTMKKYRDEAVSSLTLEGFATAKALIKTIQKSKRGGSGSLQEMFAETASMDLGGLSIVSSAGTGHLSNYLDIALFSKGSDLLF